MIMIDWDKVEDEITSLIHPHKIAKYFKSLISKEFKLVAKGKYDGIYPVNMKDEIVVTICIKEPVKRLMKELIEFDNKNISIYISENKEE